MVGNVSVDEKRVGSAYLVSRSYKLGATAEPAEVSGGAKRAVQILPAEILSVGSGEYVVKVIKDGRAKLVIPAGGFDALGGLSPYVQPALAIEQEPSWSSPRRSWGDLPEP
jgi:hypothetical protein